MNKCSQYNRDYDFEAVNALYSVGDGFYEDAIVSIFRMFTATTTDQDYPIPIAQEAVKKVFDDLLAIYGRKPWSEEDFEISLQLLKEQGRIKNEL